MSNNKQSMKLYTEEELRKHLYNHDESFFEKLTPIELPSDEEIKKESEWLDNPLERLNFQEGIKWMRDNLEGWKNLPLGSTLEGGNNEQQQTK
jgi:hypothetical protein